MTEAVVERHRADTESTLDDILEDVRDSAAQKGYTNIEFYSSKSKKAGTKLCFSGHDGERNVILTVQRRTAGNPIAESPMRAGYGLVNEVKIAKKFGLDDAIINHLAVHYDTFTTKRGEFVAVSPEIEGTPLIDYVENCKFDLNAFKEFFSDMLRTHLFLKQNGIYHRDNSPSNVLVKRKNNRTQAWTTDLGSACEIETAKAETLQTTGARTVRDPRIKDGQKYSDAQEIYAIAQNMLVSLNGEPAVKYDSEGVKHFDSEQHDALINTAIGKLPKWARKTWKDRILDRLGLGRQSFEEIIYKAMSSEGGYNSIQEFQKDFEEASKPSLWEQIKKNKILPYAGLIGITGLVIGLSAIKNVERDNQVLEKIIEEARKYQVTTEWNGSDIELRNNLVDFEPSVLKRNPFVMLYSPENKPKFLILERGAELEVVPTANRKPLPGEAGKLGGFWFPGKVYFEGYEGVKFNTDAVIPDPTQYDMGSPNIPWVEIKVPENMPEGVWNLIVELYAPVHKKQENHHTAYDHVNFENPGRAIARKRIPVIVGNPETALNVTSAVLGGFSESLAFERLRRDPDYVEGELDYMKAGLTYQYSIPELGFTNTIVQEKPSMNAPSGGICAPAPEDDREVTLIAIVRDGKRIINYNGFPIKGRKSGNNYDWVWSVPGENFSDKLMQYRRYTEGKCEAPKFVSEEVRDSTLEYNSARMIVDDMKSRYGNSYMPLIHDRVERGIIDRQALKRIEEEDCNLIKSNIEKSELQNQAR